MYVCWTYVHAHSHVFAYALMYRELQCVPDVWSLVEWSNWLTPESLPRRYDTVFYLCCINERPTATPENEEIIRTEVRMYVYTYAHSHIAEYTYMCTFPTYCSCECNDTYVRIVCTVCTLCTICTVHTYVPLLNIMAYGYYSIRVLSQVCTLFPKLLKRS